MSAGSGLRKRALTAFILGPLAMAAILGLPTPGFAMVFGAVLMVGAWEWGGLAGLTGVPARGAFAATFAGAMLALWALPHWHWWLIGGAGLWWVFQTAELARAREIVPASGREPWLLALGLPLLLAPWVAVVKLHGSGANGPLLALLLALLVWTADSLAYFAGRRWGRAKLAPRLSPGKTRVGAYAALAGGVLWGLPLAWLCALDSRGAALAALVCLFTVALSVVGDLYESLLKRRRGLKDSSHLLPGHGGMLDRVDSFVSAAPVFALGLAAIGGLT